MTFSPEKSFLEDLEFSDDRTPVDGDGSHDDQSPLNENALPDEHSAFDAPGPLDAYDWSDDDFHVESTVPQANGAAVELPPERVRFATPIQVRKEGDDVAMEGTVFNLSISGLACSLPLQIEEGERVWGEFRVSLGEEPVALFCEVIWRREKQNNSAHVLYGFRFISLTEVEESQLSDVVSERAEGRSAAWPLPLMPEESASYEEAKARMSPVLTGVVGAIAGIVLTVSIYSFFGAGQQTAMAELIRADGSQNTMAAAGNVANANHTQQTQRAAQQLPEPPAMQAATQQSAQKQDANSVAPAETSTVTSNNLIVLDAVGEQTVTTGDEVSIQLLADNRVGEFQHFWLDSPRRLVVDIAGGRSALIKDDYRIEHPLVSRVRVGEHSDKVRFVIDMATNAKLGAAFAAEDSALTVTLSQ